MEPRDQRKPPHLRDDTSKINPFTLGAVLTLGVFGGGAAVLHHVGFRTEALLFGALAGFLFTMLMFIRVFLLFSSRASDDHTLGIGTILKFSLAFVGPIVAIVVPAVLAVFTDYNLDPITVFLTGLGIAVIFALGWNISNRRLFN